MNAAGGAEDTSRHLVMLVHGINTRAQWMSTIKPVLVSNGLIVEATSYGKFGVPRFILPFAWLRKGAVERVAQAIATAQMLHQPTKMSVISHSFGTYVISQILADYPQFKWHRIIFCGSVVRDDYRLDRSLQRFDPPLLNEVGSEDFLPALAESVSWGYGSVGSNGYNAVGVDTRWHSGLRHSDFLTAAFCQKFWLPFLTSGTIVPGDASSKLSLWTRAITGLPIRWLQPVLAAIVVLCAISLVPGDPAASTNESPQSRVSSFTLHRPGESFEPGDRYWSHPVEDRWIERYPSGLSSTFNVVKRTSANSCNGTVVAKQGEENLELFIPDKNCEQLVIKWRRRSQEWWVRFRRADLKWRDLSLMQEVK